MKIPVNAGKRLDGTIPSFIFPREVWLSNLHGAGEGGKKDSRATGITITEGQVARVESTLVRIAKC